MNKILFLLLFCSSTYLLAKEPNLAILQSVNSNTNQLFKSAHFTFTCSAYAVLAIERLENNEKINDTCKKNIQKFYLQNPLARYYAQRKLKIMQRYHVEFVESECLLFANGEVTLSEMLLREGLAVLKQDFKDKEYSFVYKKAQESAKREKKGVWSDDIGKSCIEEIYKK